MKKSFKKIAVLIVMLILATEVTTVVQEVNVSAASTESIKDNAKKAYKNYVQRYLLSSFVSSPYGRYKLYPGGRYKLYDIDRNGVPEMIFTYAAGVRCGYKIYTYKKGKIIKMLDVTGASAIYRNAKKKQIYITFSGGAAYNIIKCYKMKNKKLVYVRNGCVNKFVFL